MPPKEMGNPGDHSLYINSEKLGFAGELELPELAVRSAPADKPRSISVTEEPLSISTTIGLPDGFWEHMHALIEKERERRAGIMRMAADIMDGWRSYSTWSVPNPDWPYTWMRVKRYKPRQVTEPQASTPKSDKKPLVPRRGDSI